MLTIVLSVLGFALLVTAMAVGVIFSNKPIAGSCGGLNNIGMKEDCDICGGNDTLCEEDKKKRQRKNTLKRDVLSVGSAVPSMFTDATKK